MRTSLVRFASVAALTVAAIAAACGEDEVGTVRARPDGGTAATDGGDAGEQEMLACGVLVPAVYASTNLAANAKEELELKDRFEQLVAKMRSAEGTNNTVVTGGELRAIYEAGTPSLRSISTSATHFQPPRGRIAGLRMHSVLNSALNASARALSYESPLDPTDATAPASASRSV